MSKHISGFRAALAALPLLFAGAGPAAAQPLRADAAVQAPTYADLVDLAEAAGLVARARVVDQATVKPERAPGLAPGRARLFVEAQTEALLTGQAALGESLRYLVDMPVNAKGKPPKLKKSSVLLFARAVPGRPGELQLVRPDAQLPADPQIESRLRAILTDLAAPDAPPRITGVRDVISVPGNLAGESETQMFLETRQGDPVSLTILRRPGMEPQWGISWSEIVDQSARPPEPETIEWYRLACFLPRGLPADAYLQDNAASRAQAEADYELVIERLGACERSGG
ncbi:hypothetical protein [Altericroceibacterium xinjiangense]|uniref:hypothetical protein n=1 Tax=Altericroceibacterium xinjiangense TaxID=762261 RepID=UPI001F49D2EF|nr:hypothetical protein [Altericroceibacterium xinjiangense]